MRKDAIISLIDRYHENKPRFFSLTSFWSPLEYFQKISDSQTKAEEQLIQLLESFIESESIKTREDDSQITLSEIKSYLKQQNRRDLDELLFTENYYLTSKTVVATLIKQMVDAEKRSLDYSDLNEDVWREISSHLDVKSINALSVTSSTYFYLIKKHDQFWQNKLVELGYSPDLIATLVTSRKIFHYKNLYKSSSQLAKKEKLPTKLTELTYMSGEPKAILDLEKNSEQKTDKTMPPDISRKNQLVAVSGSASAIKLMVENSVKKKNYNYKLLHYAALSGNLTAMQEAKKYLPLSAVNSESNDWDHSLHWAVLSGSVSALNEAIALGGRPGYTDTYRTTSLHFAIRSGNVRMVKEMKKYHCNPNAITNHHQRYNTSILATAIYTKNIAMVQEVLALGASVKAQQASLNEILGSCSPLIIDELIKNGLDIGYVDNKGNTLLLYAARHANIPLMKGLLRAGIDPAHLNKAKENILHFLAESLNAKAILFMRLYLHKKNIDIHPNENSSKGLDAFQYAEKRTRLELNDINKNSKEKEMLKKQLEEVKAVLSRPIEEQVLDADNNSVARPSSRYR